MRILFVIENFFISKQQVIATLIKTSYLVIESILPFESLIYFE